jgi:DNA repair photolyase
MSNYLTRPLSLSSQFSHCALPLRLDSYRGCSFSCTYCFARTRGGNVQSHRIVPANPKTLRNIFLQATRGYSSSIIHQFLRRRVPIHFGGMSDPFQPRERRDRISFEFLSELEHRGYPTVISTKSSLPMEKPYFDLLSSGWPVIVQFSVTSTEDKRAAHVEPYATPPSVLWKTMESLARAGVVVTCRWQPFIEDLVEDPFVYVRRIAEAGASHVSLEHLKIPVERTIRTKNDGEFSISNLRERYRRQGMLLDGREYVLEPVKKLANAISVRKIVYKHGMTFGAGDNELQFLSDGEACCSGIDRFRGFENVFKHQIALAVKRGTKKGAITIQSISDEWAPVGSIDRYLNSRTRISTRLNLPGSVTDHIRYRWDNLNSSENPSRFLGVTVSDQRDRTGARVFEFHLDRFKREGIGDAAIARHCEQARFGTV